MNAIYAEGHGSFWHRPLPLEVQEYNRPVPPGMPLPPEHECPGAEATGGRTEAPTAGVLLGAWSPWFKCLEEVVTLVIDEDEGREVLHVNLPDSLHAELGIFHTFDTLDARLRQDCSHTADTSEIEAAILLTSIGNHLRTVTLCNHHKAGT